MSKENQGGPAGQGSDSETIRKLVAARDRVARGWCQYTPARDANGNAVTAESEKAVEWCMAGALIAEGATDSYGCFNERDPAVRLIVQVTRRHAFGDWNDEHELEDVLEVFDKAIAIASNASAAESRPQEDPQP